MTKVEMAKHRRRRAAMLKMRRAGAKLSVIAARWGMKVSRVSVVLKEEAERQAQAGSTDKRNEKNG